MSKIRTLPWRLALVIILTVSACSMPTSLPFGQPTATPTVVQEPLPPALVEADPPDGSQITLQNPITLFFNQPMDQASVEVALSGLPAGQIEWLSNTTLTYTPDQPLLPNTPYSLTFGTSVRSANGLTVPEAFTLTYQTADYLRPAQLLPEAGSNDVTPDSAVVANFNQPVVPLGADPASLPSAFSLQPAASGRGEWINTSTYIFYPDPPLAGGVTYIANLNPALVATSGAGLDQASGQTGWNFTTALPNLISLKPSSEQPIGLDQQFKLTFNQPMDQASLKSHFSLEGPTETVAGTFTWNEDQTEVTFEPDELLERNTSYTLKLDAETQARGGTPLGVPIETKFSTVSNLRVISTDPQQGGTKTSYSVDVVLSAPLADEKLTDYITVSPEVSGLSANFSKNERTLSIHGNFIPETSYLLTLSNKLSDRWGQTLGAPYNLKFSTPPANPSLTINGYGSQVAFVRPIEASLGAQATNIRNAEVSIAPLAMSDFFSLNGPNGYELRQNYSPDNIRRLSENYYLKSSQSQQIDLPLAPGGATLDPGLYFVRVQSAQLTERAPQPLFVVSSSVNLTFEAGATEALVWAVDLRTQAPVSDAPVSIYSDNGSLLASGQTDANGLWQGNLPDGQNNATYAMLGQPGEANFGMAVSGWNIGIASWDFGLRFYKQLPFTDIYMYTDRPIYRPGQTVYFRGVVRETFNARYELPKLSSITLDLSSDSGTAAESFTLQLSDFGTFHGQYTLPPDAAPGYYTFQSDNPDLYFSFQVADYRKPEINLSLNLSPDQAQQGQSLQASVNARYFFDAPAGGLPISWTLYARDTTFSLPGYRVGPYDAGWLQPYRAIEGIGPSDYYGPSIDSGEARTSADGTLNLSLPSIEAADTTRILTLEVTTKDESGFPLSARDSLTLHPSDHYIGLKPDLWVGQAGTEMGFEAATVDLDKNPSPERSLTADFSQVTWERRDPPEGEEFGVPTFEPVYKPVDSQELVTDADGKASLAFTPETPGTYMLDVHDGETRSQVLLWVSGAERAVWPNLANQHIELTADQDSYQAGDTAQIFIPNPIGEQTLALVSVSRAVIFEAQVVQLESGGSTFSLPIRDDHAPNVYVTVTLVGPNNQFRQGYINLPVEPAAQELHVELLTQPERAGPGDEVTLDLRVTDSNGKPVEGEFSLAVVDLAALALADPNAPDILPAFYSQQPLGVETNLSLAAYTYRNSLAPAGGRGGGGGLPITSVARENFPDTAYWNPTLVTDSNGRGQVTFSLPDNLTTWQIDARGLTADTRVGQATSQIISTKPLLIRPVTPRFLVAGDHLELAAIVHNNTGNNQQVSVNLEATNFQLDRPELATQVINVPAGERARVSWWGTTQDADQADLVFSVQVPTQAGATEPLNDSARPSWGALPILHYTSPQAFITAGVIPEAGSRLEVISLPRSFSPTSGELAVEMSPSLAASLLSGLEAMPIPETASTSETILSYLLPNLAVYQTLQAAGLDAPDLADRLQANQEESVRRLLERQNEDGGWGWQSIGQGQSDPYISAYILFGLQKAKQAGSPIGEAVFENGRRYLTSERPYLEESTLENWQMDRLAFIEYVLQETGGAETQAADSLYGWRDRLSPWAKALLALTLEGLAPGDTRANNLISNLETNAIRSASGAYWESDGNDWHNPGTPRFTTAVVVYALAQRDPAAQSMTEAVRFLSSVRNASGLWGSSYENAWVILGLTEAMRGSGELQANFAYSADLNNRQLASGQANGPQATTPVITHVPIGDLLPAAPNGLKFSREDGIGQLYYRAALQVNQPVGSIKPLKQGLGISRSYFDASCENDCPALTSAQLQQTNKLKVQLTLNLPHDSYYIQVADYIPAGSEILNQALKTSQQGEAATDVSLYDPANPYARGWGWWLFNNPKMYDDHILWTADYLPAGTYELTYTLVPLQAGEYRVLPAHAWLTYFPDVQATSGGTIFEIKP